MIESTGYLSDHDYAETTKRHESKELNSRFTFLSDHNGFRRGELHILTGPKGGSKSTLIKTMILEQAARGKKVCLYLSEEDPKNYVKVLNDVARNETNGEETLANINIISELEFTDETRNLFWDWFCLYMEEKEIDILFLDNFTTSFLSQCGFQKENQNIIKLRSLAKEKDIPVMSVHHTIKGTNVDLGLIDSESTRGSGTTINLGSYNYVITTFFSISPPRTFVLVDKSRYHQKANKQYYELHYDSKLSLFVECMRSKKEFIEKTRKKALGKTTKAKWKAVEKEDDSND